jgi:hypothetical protein
MSDPVTLVLLAAFGLFWLIVGYVLGVLVLFRIFERRISRLEGGGQEDG